MVQSKITLTEELSDFLSFHKEFGYKNRSEMIREALEAMKQKLDKEKLTNSANLYSELYNDDDEAKEWIEDVN
jgi:Arc/MetJ-type ribon-helix-helix transcriptional regulator